MNSSTSTFCNQYKPGDLRIDWTPRSSSPAHAFQPGFRGHAGRPFVADVATVEEGARLLKALTRYDAYRTGGQGFIGSGGLNRWTLDSDEQGTPGWESWEDPQTGETDPLVWLEAQEAERMAESRPSFTPIGISADHLSVIAQGKGLVGKTRFVRADAAYTPDLIVEGITYRRKEEITDEEWETRRYNYRPLPE